MDDRNIYYACGFMPTDSAELIMPRRAWLITDSRYTEDAQRRCFAGVEVLLNSGAQPLMRTLGRLCAEIEGDIGAECEKLSHLAWLNTERALGRQLVGADAVMNGLRAHKTRDELATLIRAQRIAEAALEAVIGYEDSRAGTKSMRLMVTGMIRDEPDNGSFMQANPTMKNVYLVHQMINDQEKAVSDYIRLVRALEDADPAERRKRSKRASDEDYE